MNTDGSGLRQIGSCIGVCVFNDDPQYSLDGTQIVYTRLMHVPERRSRPRGLGDGRGRQQPPSDHATSDAGRL